MTVGFPFKEVHSCQAVIVMCMDFRFWKLTLAFLRNLGIEEFDLIALPGAVRMIAKSDGENPVIKSILTSVELHGAREVILIDHADCGAYGGRKAFSGIDAETIVHLADIKEAKEKIRRQLKVKITVKGFYATLSEARDKVSFVSVD